jgi:hypothetical protein
MMVFIATTRDSSIRTSYFFTLVLFSIILSFGRSLVHPRYLALFITALGTLEL